MISGSNNSINWEALNRLVDPRYNSPSDSIDTSSGRAIEIDAHYRENAMAELNSDQKDLKQRLLERYKDDQLDPAFCNECDNQIKQYIINAYAKDPAMHDGKALPLEYDANLNGSYAVRQAYYQNAFHTAYRYFVLHVDKKPNLWMDPNAQYMGNLYYKGNYYKTPQIPEENRQLIRAMWFAVNDPEFTLSDMHTPETAKQELINVFGQLGRAHNWDQTRWVTKPVKGDDGITRNKQVEEEYDDLGADKPSCPWGVETRLTQFVMLALKEDANERMLNANIVRNKFKEEMISVIEGKNTLFGAIAKMDLPTLTKLNEALLDFVVINTGDFDGLEEDQKALLKQIQCYSTKEVENFINGCKAYYGDFRFTQKMSKKVNYQDLSFDNYGQLALQFARDPWVLFYDAIAENINKRIAELSNGKVNDVQAPQVTHVDVADTTIEQDVEILRQQLIELSIRNQQEGLLNQLFSADDNFIKQTALQYKAQLPQIARQSDNAAQEEAARVEAARVEAARVEAARVEAARVEAARVEAARVEAARVEEETARQQILDYAFENGDEALAVRMLDAPLQEIQQELENIQVAQNQLAADLAFARRLEEEYEVAEQREEQQRRHQEIERLAQLQRQQVEAARLAAERLAAEQNRLQLAEGFRLAALRQQQALASSVRPALTPVFTNARKQADVVEVTRPSIKPELASLFNNEIARRLLTNINENEATVTVLNGWQKELVTRLITALGTDDKLQVFQKMNNPTKVVFIERFAEKFQPAARAILV